MKDHNDVIGEEVQRHRVIENRAREQEPSIHVALPSDEQATPSQCCAVRPVSVGWASVGGEVIFVPGSRIEGYLPSKNGNKG